MAIDPKNGIGISWLWMLPPTHPFQAAGLWHDAQYIAREQGKLKDTDSRRVDKVFYNWCMDIAREKNSLWLKSQAKLFYGLTRAWGSVKWPQPQIINVTDDNGE